MRVVVVGAGVIGSSIAQALAQGGADVTVIDMRSAGRGASQASAGVLAPYTEAHGKTALLELCVRSLEMFDAFLDNVRTRSGSALDYDRTGTVEVAQDDADVRRLRDAHAWLRDNGVGGEWIDAPALRTFEPAISQAALGALHIPVHGFVHVPALVAALVQSARLAGATFDSPVEAVGIDPRTDRVEVRAGARSYSADHVVLAAGSWSRRVRVAGLPALPVRPIRGQLLHLRWPSTGQPSRVVWGSRCYTVPWSDGSVLVGATVEDVGFDESSTVDGVRSLTEAVVELLPASRDAALAEVRVGLRPAAPDGLPIIGPSTYYSQRHVRDGPLSQRHSAGAADGLVRVAVHPRSRSDPALAVTSPDRFDRSQSQNGGARMKLSAADVKKRLSASPGWVKSGDAIHKLYTFQTFPDAIAFVTRLAFDAEAADHHPDLHVSYRKVTVTWTTHSEGGLTTKDFDGAQPIGHDCRRMLG